MLTLPTETEGMCTVFRRGSTTMTGITSLKYVNPRARAQTYARTHALHKIQVIHFLITIPDTIVCRFANTHIVLQQNKALLDYRIVAHCR